MAASLALWAIWKVKHYLSVLRIEPGESFAASGKNAAYEYLIERALLDYKIGAHLPADAAIHTTAMKPVDWEKMDGGQ